MIPLPYFLASIIIAFIIGVTVVLISPINSGLVSASIQNLYQTSQPPLPKEGDYLLSNCDWFGNNCQKIDITDDERERIFDNWCYSVQGTYAVGKVTQTVRTMSHDCESYILDEKLKPLNEKIDSLKNEIKILENRTR